MARTIADEAGVSIPALYYSGSRVLQLNGTTQVVDPDASVAVTITVTADTWLRVGRGAVLEADGLDGCDYLPAGTKWTEGIHEGERIALATVDGAAAVAVVRFAEE